MSNKNYNQTLQSNNTSLEDIITQLNNLPDAGEGGIDTSDATAAAADILSGKTAYVKDQKITGIIPTKTASSLTVSGATVTVPAGYYATQTTKSVATATQATPSITVSSAGLITASSTQSAGYVASGTKSATKQLTTQAAKTVTPTTSNQTAVASGVYTTGAITVKGDANLKAENIKSGVSVFGVTGTASTGGVDTSDATATAEEIFAGETAYGANGKVTGTFTIDEEITTQTDLISDIQAVIGNKVGVGGSGSLETCTIIVKVDSWSGDSLTQDISFLASVIENNIQKLKFYRIDKESYELDTDVIIENVVCNSNIIFCSYAIYFSSITNCTVMMDKPIDSDSGSGSIIVISAPSSKDNTGIIEFEEWE